MSKDDDKKSLIDMADETVFIKASTPEEMEEAKRVLEVRLNHILATRRQKEINERDNPKIEKAVQSPGGGVVLGRLSAEEINAIKTNNDAELRRLARNRARSIRRRRK